MSESADRSRATEASRWFTVMTRPDVSPGELDAFRIWRRDPENAAALAKVKAGWDAAGGLTEQPAILSATDAVLAKYPPKIPARAGAPRRFVLKRLALGGAALLVVGGGALLTWYEMAPDYATAVGGQRLEVLADGSRVRLNTDSRLRVAFRDNERRVVLERGQAFFDVAHDAARPFVVEADGARVRALGTRFDVRRLGETVRVTLVQGRVEVRGDQGGAAVLSPGQAVVVDRRSVSRPAATDAAAVSSWTSGRITFSGVPLRDAVAEVNRYSVRKVVLETSAAVAEERVSGQFVAGDVDNFVAGARALYGLRIVSETPREIRLAPG